MTALVITVGVLALHAASSENPTPEEGTHTPYRYTAVELAEEAIDAYEALGTNDVAACTARYDDHAEIPLTIKKIGA